MRNNYRRDDKMFNLLRNVANPYSLKNMVYEKATTGIYDAIKNKFGLEFKISTNEMDSAFQWISKHDKRWEKHVSNPQSILIKNTKDKKINNKYIVDKEYIFKLEKATYTLVMAGPSRSTYKGGGDDPLENVPSYLYIYIFGKKMLKYSRQLANELTTVKREFLTLYKVSGGTIESVSFEVLASDLHTRPLDTLFFNDNVKEDIINHIDKFLSNEDLYKERSLMYKTGILLYGDPGTGKSSLATAIATKYGYDVVSIDMTTFNNLDVNTLVESLNADNYKYIVLLEDIDAVIKNRNGDIDKEDDKNINKLLQFLDSSSSPTDVIFIATTNYVDTLDSALIRDGRFDIKCEVGELKLSRIDEMCKSFNLSDDDINNIREQLKQEGRKTVNQSKLQNMILKCIENQISNK